MRLFCESYSFVLLTWVSYLYIFIWEMIFWQPLFDNFWTTFSLILTWCCYPLSSFFSLHCFWPIRSEKNKGVNKVVIKWMSKYHYSIKKNNNINDIFLKKNVNDIWTPLNLQHLFNTSFCFHHIYHTTHYFFISLKMFD
jgi:hypothetical protein